jgi:hypothetical protein
MAKYMDSDGTIKTARKDDILRGKVGPTSDPEFAAVMTLTRQDQEDARFAVSTTPAPLSSDNPEHMRVLHRYAQRVAFNAIQKHRAREAMELTPEKLQELVTTLERLRNMPELRYVPERVRAPGFSEEPRTYTINWPHLPWDWMDRRDDR